MSYLLGFALIASASAVQTAPATYRSLPAAEKLSIVMDQIKATAYPAGQLPTKGLGFLKATNLVCSRFLTQAFTGEIDNPTDNSDILPKSREGVKVVHTYGSVASVAIKVTNLNHPFSGMFRYNTIGVLRLSPAIHSKTKLIPALSLKALFNGQDSVNFLALHSLEGQPGDNNYFSNPLRTRLGAPGGLPEKILNFFFQNALKSVPKGPYSSLALPLDEAALKISDVAELNHIEIPTMLEFRPTAEVQKIYADTLRTPMTADEYRERFAALPIGTVLFKYFGTAQDGHVYEIGQVEMTSQFMASLYGDQVLFFKHQVRAAAQK